MNKISKWTAIIKGDKPMTIMSKLYLEMEKPVNQTNKTKKR